MLSKEDFDKIKNLMIEYQETGYSPEAVMVAFMGAACALSDVLYQKGAENPITSAEKKRMESLEVD